MKKFSVGLIQMNSGTDINANMREAQRLLGEAAQRGAGFVMFPECSEYIGPDMAAHASAIPGYVSRCFTRLAKQYRVYLHCGSMTVQHGPGKPENMSLLFRPDGSILAGYSKLHLFDVDGAAGVSCRESASIRSGDEIVMAETEFATFGMSICYDLRFPELYRLMAQNGANVLLVAANFTRGTGEKHWETLLRARAIENGCYVLAAAQCGQKYSFLAHGHSMIIAPDGTILAEASGDWPEVLVAELDPMAVVEARAQIPSLQHVRDDIYELSAHELGIYED